MQEAEEEAAGLEVPAGARDPAHAAQPGPAPSTMQLPHSGPYHEVSPALGLWGNKWCPR